MLWRWWTGGEKLGRARSSQCNCHEWSVARVGGHGKGDCHERTGGWVLCWCWSGTCNQNVVQVRWICAKGHIENWKWLSTMTMRLAASLWDDDCPHQRWIWWLPARLKGSGEKELVARNINGILATRGRLNRAEGCNKNWWWLATTRMVALLQESVWLGIKWPKKIEDSSWQDQWDCREREIGLCQRLRKKWKMVRDNEINSVIARGSKAHNHAAGKKGLRWKGHDRTRGWACSFNGAWRWDTPAEIRFGGMAMGCTSWDRRWRRCNGMRRQNEGMSSFDWWSTTKGRDRAQKRDEFKQEMWDV